MIFIRRSLFFLILSFLLFIFPIIINDWFVDHVSPIALFSLSLIAFIYIPVKCVFYFVKKKTFYYADFFLPIIPLLFGMLLHHYQLKNFVKIESQLIQVNEKLMSCNNIDNCKIPIKYSKRDNGIVIDFTKGVTTLHVRYSYLENCLNVNPSYSLIRAKHYHYCK